MADQQLMEGVSEVMAGASKLIAHFASAGSGTTSVDVPQNGMPLRAFLTEAGANYDSARSKGVSFVNENGDTLDEEDSVLPGSIVTPVTNRDNGWS